MKKYLTLLFCINIVFLQDVNSSVSLYGDDTRNYSELLEAISDYERLIQKYPNKKKLHYNLGNINYLYGDFESAIENYTNALDSQDDKDKAHALYNLGNIFYEQEAFEKSIEFYKQALKFSPDDKDARHNFELSKIMLQKQSQQKKQDNDRKNKNEKQENNTKNNEEKNEDEGDGKNNLNNDQKEDQGGESNSLENNNSQSKNNKEESISDGKEKSVDNKMPSDSIKISNEDIEKKIGKQEAEAILNALKANETNMKNKKYKAVGRLKVEKDW